MSEGKVINQIQDDTGAAYPNMHDHSLALAPRR